MGKAVERVARNSCAKWKIENEPVDEKWENKRLSPLSSGVSRSHPSLQASLKLHCLEHQFHLLKTKGKRLIWRSNGSGLIISPPQHFQRDAFLWKVVLKRKGERGEGCWLWCDMAWHGTARHGPARPGPARYGTVRYGTVRYGTVRYGTGTLRYGMAWHGISTAGYLVYWFVVICSTCWV